MILVMAVDLIVLGLLQSSRAVRERIMQKQI